jgi:ABC-2 type transport system permease protein
MVGRIIRHDLRLLGADKTLRVVAGLFILLIGYGTFNGARWTRARARVVNDLIERGEKSLAVARAELREIESGDNPLPTSPPAAALPTGKSYPVTLSPAPLSPLSVGQSDLYPYTATVDIYATKHALFNFYEQDNPLNLLAGRFDLAFVIVYLFPILILALSYNLISQERESGTLQMTLAQPLTLRAFALSKVGSRLAIVLSLGIGLSLLGVLLSGASLTAAGALPRLVLWTGMVVAYTLLWFALAVAVNSLGKSSAMNATALVGIWIVLVIVIPSLLSVAATSVHPVPSRLEFVSMMREADNYTRSAGQQLLAKYYGDHPELVPAGELDLNDFTRRFYAMRQENQRRVLPELERFEEQLARQQGLINRYRYLSPAVVMQESLNDIAGAGAARQRAFVEQARDFIDEWQRFFVPLVFRRATLRAADYDAIPRFRFQEESTIAVARRMAVGMAGLIIPTLIIGWVALARLRRYPLIG